MTSHPCVWCGQPASCVSPLCHRCLRRQQEDRWARTRPIPRGHVFARWLLVVLTAELQRRVCAEEEPVV